MPVPYSPPNVGAYTRTPFHQPLVFGRKGIDHLPYRSDDLVMPKLPTCNREWCLRRVSPSTGGDWWATCHDESCARYSRLRCDIGVSPLLPPPFTDREGVFRDSRGLQLRTQCLETWTGKRGKKIVALACPCLYPLVRGKEWGPGRG